MQLKSVPTPQLKFCGFTREKDVDAALGLRVDAIGLNFYSKSPRFLPLDRATNISSQIGSNALKVGIFVDSPIEFILEHVERCQLDVIQLHGSEELNYLQNLLSAPCSVPVAIWRAISWRGETYPEDEARVRQWHAALPSVNFLVDAHDPINKGGTGKKARWDLLTPRPQALQPVAYLLAGGITAENAAEAVRTVRPDGIDLASGIESEPGIKDHDRMKSVSDAVRSAYSD